MAQEELLRILKCKSRPQLFSHRRVCIPLRDVVAPLTVKAGAMDSEVTMKTKMEFVLLMALGITMVNVVAAAQNNVPMQAPAKPLFEYAIYDPSQSAGVLRQVDWDDRHGCDGDHDRDDRRCYGRDHASYRYRRDYYRGNGYYGNAPVYVRHGWYDRNGRWHRDNDHWHGNYQ